MKIICKADTQVSGFGIVSKGEAIEWPEGKAFPPQVLGNFKAADGAPLCNKEPQPPAMDGEGDKPADGEGDKPADGEGDKPADGEGDKPADGEGEGARQPTLEEAAAEQKRAEKIALEELVKKTAALGKQKLIAALDAAGVTYKGNASCEELAKTLLRSQGQEID